MIESIKRTTDLVALVEAKGIKLKKNGKSWFSLCPFHADKNPSLSINPNKKLWQCFGCERLAKESTELMNIFAAILRKCS